MGRLKPLLSALLFLGFLGSFSSSVFADTDALTLVRELDARIKWEPLRRFGVIVKGWNSISFSPGIPFLAVNYRTKYPVAPIEEFGGKVLLPDDAVAIIRDVLGAAKPDSDSLRVAAVLIDPGHGGRDPGTIGNYDAGGKKVQIIEKDVNLAVSRALYKSLTDTFPDKKVLLTRDDDSYPTLEERVAMANGIAFKPNEAIIFVSIHTNASLNTKAKGIEVWYLPPDYRRTVITPETHPDEPEEILPILNNMLEEEFTVESIILARKILDQLMAATEGKSESRGLKEESWFVVRNARMPSVLIELGFVTNPEEAKLLGDAEYLNLLSKGIYNGVKDFIYNFEATEGFTH